MLVKALPTNLADPSFQPRDAHSQVAAEERMALEGRDRYIERQQELADRGTAAERDDYASVIRRSLLGVADKIMEAIEKDASRRGTKRSGLLLKVEAIEEGNKGFKGVTTAYIALSTIFNSLHNTSDKAKIATKIGYALQNEFNFHSIKEQAPKAWDRLVRYAKEKGSERHRNRFVLNAAAKDGLQVEDWSVSDHTFLGEWLLGLVEEAGLIAVQNSREGVKTRSEVVLQDHVLAWLEEFRGKADAGSLPMITPVLAPMTTPPRDWSTPRNGGYEKLRYPLVKMGGQADYNNADLSKVYGAVNLMQRTAWRIHPGMLALVERMWADGKKVGKLPRAVTQKVPAKVPPEVWDTWTPEQRKGHNLQRKAIHDANRQAQSDLTTINTILAQARELADAPAIYMPYQLDYRGRAYCQPLLSPQGPDYIRAMLEFAHGKPLGERGAMWVAIQAATLWDGEYRGKRLSKSSFQARYDWAVEHEALMRSVVDDPLGDTSWAQADKPFMFLRTAIAWVQFLDHGETFVSTLPIALDGSCSGIQHYAAILRDEVVGRRVNLLPSEEPADVYGDVADLVVPMVKADAGTEEADLWLSLGVSRKVVKRPTMTYVYSSREEGFTRVYDHEFIQPKTGRSNQVAARYLARKTLTAVEQLLPTVAAGMDWLITCARLLAHEGKPIAWTAPSGFPVVQRCISAPAVRVETMLGGERLRVSIPGSSKTIAKDRQKNAISPNHTHSLDAAHLVLTVLQASEYGVTEFALIHDSFGTLAADTDAMFSATRDAFVKMYEENDPFQHLYEQVYEALSEAGREKLPLPPSKGSLDLSQVQQSLYAFA